jgi:hypothetical protein
MRLTFLLAGAMIIVAIWIVLGGHNLGKRGGPQ